MTHRQYREDNQWPDGSTVSVTQRDQPSLSVSHSWLDKSHHSLSKQFMEELPTMLFRKKQHASLVYSEITLILSNASSNNNHWALDRKMITRIVSTIHCLKYSMEKYYRQKCNTTWYVGLINVIYRYLELITSFIRSKDRISSIASKKTGNQQYTTICNNIQINNIQHYTVYSQQAQYSNCTGN